MSTHVMSRTCLIYTLGFLRAFPHCSPPLHSSPCFALTLSYHLFIMSAFFDGNMGPHFYNAEMQANWSQYTDWQYYMLTRDIEAVETSQKMDMQYKLLDKVLSSLLELQLDFKAYKSCSACHSCGRRGVKSPAPVGRSYGGRNLPR